MLTHFRKMAPFCIVDILIPITLVWKVIKDVLYAVGHWNDGLILLLRPESFSFSFFLSYLNFVIPAKFE